MISCPEFLARLSEIVPFSPINETMLVRIFEVQLKGVIALLEKQHIDIEITEKAKNLLATRGSLRNTEHVRWRVRYVTISAVLSQR